MQETAQYLKKRVCIYRSFIAFKILCHTSKLYKIFVKITGPLMLGRWSPRTRDSTWSSSPWASSTRRSTSSSCSTCTVARSTLTRHASLPPLSVRLSKRDQTMLIRCKDVNSFASIFSSPVLKGYAQFWFRFRIRILIQNPIQIQNRIHTIFFLTQFFI